MTKNKNLINRYNELVISMQELRNEVLREINWTIFDAECEGLWIAPIDLYKQNGEFALQANHVRLNEGEDYIAEDGTVFGCSEVISELGTESLIKLLSRIKDAVKGK